MIKIKLYEPTRHRNECAFRAYIWAQHVLRDIGIEFTTGDTYDYALVNTFYNCDKKLPLDQAVEKGLDYLSKITGDYILLDGQDSTSLIGAAELLRGSNAKFLLKNTLLNDWNLYKQGWHNGRIYWGPGEYKVPDIDELKGKIKLSGTNWVGTIRPKWLKYNSDKSYDVSCMFGWGDNLNYEHGILTSNYYDDHRKFLLDRLENTKYNVLRRERGIRIPQQQFYENMYNSKIVTAPIGYGEMAVRDIEAASFGSVLIKPDMSYIKSVPFLYEDDETYIACKYDWSDIEEKIDYVLSNWTHLQDKLTYNMRKRFEDQYNDERLATHLYNIFANLDGIEHE
tara:strand:- start:2911 stop:3927 length:1017 start_codon:yes stop_codon:yes gene_type:complete